MKEAIVLGAGMQGCCVALMLATHGYSVRLIDKSVDIINRASANQEGKIHLGFVYGLDSSFLTARRILQDALHFAPYLEYLLDEKLDWSALSASEFTYLQAHDSLMSSGEILKYFTKIQNEYHRLIRKSKLNYLGNRPEKLFAQIDMPEELNSDLFKSAFQTSEAALDLLSMKKLIKSKIISCVEMMLEVHVDGIEKMSQSYSLNLSKKDGTKFKATSDLIVNCLWEDNSWIDTMIFKNHESKLNIRMKCGIIVKAQSVLNTIPSFTIIQGPYGDFVNYRKSGTCYFSWYPVSMKGMIVGQRIPSEWENFLSKKMPNDEMERLVNDNWASFKKMIPGLGKFDVINVLSGLIVAKGTTDINFTSSELHKRDQYPLKKERGYYSIYTGKYTSAPNNTRILENEIIKDRPGVFSKNRYIYK